MPTRRKGEPLSKFVSRCVPIVMKEGTAKNQKQAVAICYSMGRKKSKSKFRGPDIFGSSKRGRSILAELKIKDWLSFEGTVELQAAAATESADAERPLVLTAYTGRAMDLNGWPYPVVIDLRGARFDKSVTPIIADHKTERRVGHTTSQVILQAGRSGTFAGKEVKGPFIGAVGVRSSDMEIAKGIVKDLRAGFP